MTDQTELKTLSLIVHEGEDYIRILTPDATTDDHVAEVYHSRALADLFAAAPALLALAHRFASICEAEADSWSGGGSETELNIESTWTERLSDVRAVIEYATDDAAEDEDEEDEADDRAGCERCGTLDHLQEVDGEDLCTDCQHAAQDGSLYGEEG